MKTLLLQKKILQVKSTSSLLLHHIASSSSEVTTITNWCIFFQTFSVLLHNVYFILIYKYRIMCITCKLKQSSLSLVTFFFNTF